MVGKKITQPKLRKASKKAPVVALGLKKPTTAELLRKLLK